MIKKWEIQPAPTDRNKSRHKLLLKCDMKDIFFIVKKLGSICSRPEKTSGDYTFLIYLSKLEMDTMSKLKEVIKSLSDIKEEEDKEKTQVEVKVSSEPVFDLNQIKEKEGSSGTIKVPPLNLNAGIPPSPDIKPPSINLSQSNSESIVTPPKIEAPVHDVKAQISEDKKQIKKKKIEPELEKAVPSGPVSQQSPSRPVPPGEEISKIREVLTTQSTGGIKKGDFEKTLVQKPSQPIPVDIRVNRKLKWTVELPLNPTLTFQTLIAGPHNRFAHAAAMAVVENPGVMYNPLLIFGPRGIGKSHFMHSMAYGLASNIGQENIFVTNAIKLSIGVDRAIQEGWIDSIEKTARAARVIIIDDINLFMLTEKNKPFISKLLNDCLNANKQIIVSSLFPPKSLASMEESLGFQFTQGWMVDIKTPNSETYKLILNQLLSSMDIKMSEEDIQKIFLSKMMDFTSVFRILSAAKRLEKYLLAIDNSLMHKDIVEILMGMKGDDGSPPSQEEIASAQAISFPQEKQWFRLGLFYPEGLETQSKYVLGKIKEFAKELNMSFLWNQIFIEKYNSDEVFGMPFKIANFSAQKDINGLIIIGPHPTSALGNKEMEFRHLTEKILESFNIKSGWIPADKLKAKSFYLRLLMELV